MNRSGIQEPQMNADEHERERLAGRAELNAISEQIIGAAFQVSNALGIGFVEKVYENALAMELREAEVKVEQQKPLQVRYKRAIVGEFTCDMLVEDCVMVELKAVTAFDDTHLAQCLNYLKASGLQLCLLLNFGRPKVQVRRIING
jgi:GxxExxY protein